MRIILIFLISLFIFFTLTVSIATGVSVGMTIFYEKFFKGK